MSQQERRRFVRIEDRLLLNVRRRTPQDSEAAEAYRNVKSPFENLAYQFQYLDNQLSNALNRVRTKNADIAEALNLLNQKINVAFQSAMKHLDNELYSYSNVSISACGLSIDCHQDLQCGEEVLVSLLLPPFNSPFTAYGRIVQDEEANDSRLRIEFEDLRPEQEETLIQFVIRRQNAQMIQARERQMLDQ